MAKRKVLFSNKSGINEGKFRGREKSTTGAKKILGTVEGEGGWKYGLSG